MELQYNKRSIQQVRTSKTIKLLIDQLLKDYKYLLKQLKLGTLDIIIELGEVCYYYYQYEKMLIEIDGLIG